MTPADMYDLVLLALCCWREARGEIKAAQVAQAWSVRNRVERPNFWDWGEGYSGVILKPEQYSSFDRNDPNATRIPQAADASWQQCLSVAQDVYQGIGADPTAGCTHYYDRSRDGNPPEWAERMEHVVNIGDLRFFRPKPIAMSA